MEHEPSSLRRAFKMACIASFVITIFMDFPVPMPNFFAEYVFSQGFFTEWVIISFIWVFCSTAISVVLPIIETAGFFKELVLEIGSDLTQSMGKSKGQHTSVEILDRLLKHLLWRLEHHKLLQVGQSDDSKNNDTPEVV
jgi:hypothetical protein